jgi:hypothetical protein
VGTPKPLLDAAQEGLVRLWSDPLPHAHRDWLAAFPRELVSRAADTPGARRVLAGWLRDAVPMRPLASVDGAQAVPWAAGSAREIFSAADRAGLMLMRDWIVRAVARSDVQSVIGFLGREHYDAALPPAPSLWRESAAAPSPGYGTPPDRLQQVFRSVGFHALNRAMAGRFEAFRARMRLLAGAQASAASFERDIPVDLDALLARLGQSRLPEAA